MNHSNADASVNSAGAGIRGCVNAGAAAANSTGVNSFLLFPSVYPSVSQSDVMSHPRQRHTPASERNHPPPEPSSSHASFRLLNVWWYLGENNLVPKFSRLFRTKPYQRYLEGERIKVEWFICPVQRLLAESRFDVVVRALAWSWAKVG